MMDKILNWARSRSLWYYALQTSCCADELFQTAGCRYDLERFGLLAQSDPSKADLLFVPGLITKKLEPHLKTIYESMAFPKYVIALGSCAHGGGPFAGVCQNLIVEGVDKIIPVDVYVPGCPPRPEAIMNGLITLQQRIESKNKERKVVE